jgi:vancomycin resistance protein YoaR
MDKAVFSKLLKVTIALAIPILAAIGTLAYVPRNHQGMIPQGVKVAGMDWGGKSESSARKELELWRKSQLRQSVTIKMPSESNRRRKWTPKRYELGADVDIDATLSAASHLSGDSPLERLASWVTVPKTIKLEPVWKLSHEGIRKYLKTKVAPAVYKAPRDARLKLTPAGFEKIEEESGIELDLEMTSSAVAERIPESGANAAYLSFKAAQPGVTLADLEGIDEEIARFRTFHSSGGNRAANIRLACSRMNGVVLKPGDIFSYNKIVGRRERADGYKIAPVVSEGQLVPGMAGGVCQTSSTLYNAALLADLKIVKRSNHSIPVRYLALGRDATVAWGSIDLQFQNNTDGPIAIFADGSGGQVVTRIFGRKEPGKSVEVTSSRSGLRASVWRTVKQDGTTIRRELVSRDVYKPAPPTAAAKRRAAARRVAARRRPSHRAAAALRPPVTRPPTPEPTSSAAAEP